MKRFVLFFCLAAIISANTNAATRRVGYFGPPIANVDYTSFANAYTAAAAGDTILVFPGVTNISQTISKKVIIFATGDWLDSLATPKGNSYQQVVVNNTPGISNITFATGSDGSFLEGFYGGTIYVQTSNITIARNREISVTLFNSNVTYSNLKLLQNYRLTVSANSAYGASITGLMVSNNLVTSFSTILGNSYSGSINNNVFAYDYTLSAAQNGGSSTMGNTNNLELGNGQYAITGNIFESYQSSTVSNNYLRYSFSNGGNCVYNYNLALETANPPNWGAGVGNVITPVANAANIFVGFPAIGTYSADARYKLAAGSPAATVANGGPIGMYAGTTPYKPSMIPPIPTIYKLSSPQGVNPTGSTITINVSTRGNN